MTTTEKNQQTESRLRGVWTVTQYAWKGAKIAFVIAGTVGIAFTAYVLSQESARFALTNDQDVKQTMQLRGEYNNQFSLK